MGIALFTLSAVQNPLRNLKRLFANQTRTENLSSPSAIPTDTWTVMSSPSHAMVRHSDSTGQQTCGYQAEPQGQRPLRGNWPFTAKPPARAPEAPARPSATVGRTFLPTHMAGSKRHAFLASLGADTCTPRPTEVLRRVSDTSTGRLVIAGRMADVCAELDRMAASEALQA